MSFGDNSEERTDEAIDAGSAAQSVVKRTHRWPVVLIVVALLVVIAAVTLNGQHGPSVTDAGHNVRTSGRAEPPVGLDARFAVLSVAHTSRCSLQASELGAMDPNDTLQGSCCSPMDRQAYDAQRRGLSVYRVESTIPQDPYNIAVSLARRLIVYRSIVLSSRQQAIYDRALTMSNEHGPCCCDCWRWDAFEGQAKYLITARGFDASRVASVWDLEDGCGGPPAARGTA